MADIAAQDRTVQELRNVFSAATVIDRRVSSSHGYRAVHVVVGLDGQGIEVQVRTSLQHLWAEFSEKLSDLLDPRIKYGGGDEQSRSILGETSRRIAQIEHSEATQTSLHGAGLHPDSRLEKAMLSRLLRLMAAHYASWREV